MSAGSASRPRDQPKAKTEYIGKSAVRFDRRADICDAFGGVLDLSPASRAGFFYKQMFKLIAKEMAKDTDITIEEGSKNDLRD